MRTLGGYVLVGVGAFFGVGVLLNVTGHHSGPSLLLAFLVFALAPLLSGVWLLRGSPLQAASRLAAQRAWDSELLRLAERRDGSLSVSEVVAYADLGPVEAEQRLDDLSRRGLCEVRVTEEGVVVYRFAREPTSAHKRLAQGVLDE